jgi:hypothetical protein
MVWSSAPLLKRERIGGSMVPYTLPLTKFLEYSGMGETKARELIKSGEIETAVVVGRRMVIISSYHDYVQRQQQRPQDARRNRTGVVPAFGERGRPRRRSSPEAIAT